MISKTSIRQLLFFFVLLGGALCSAQRLPGNVVPEHYSLKFAPDFPSSNFQGDATIDVRVLHPTDSIVLNAVELDIQSATVSAGGKELTASVTADPENETITLELPSQVAAGQATIHIAYTGQLNDKLHGLYRSEANHRRYAITQFEAVDARVAFPCFDEPAYKATFDVAAVIDTTDTAISNGRIVTDEPGPSGKHTVRFSTTPKMSSYLVALVVGDWKCISGEQDGIPLRVCAVPGKEQQGEFAMEATKAILHYYDQYFGIKYPYGKLDEIAAPDFEAGAMENTAAIIYRESDLLLDPSKASLNDKKEIAGVIAHEMAHQWFGDLVTMQWWNDIWLNEGFATWMESKPVAAWKPEWQISQDEVLETNNALNADSTENTRPIRQKAETRNEINSLFDAIAYGKTAAVLRMLEAFIGPEVFREGVNSYLEAHQYGNATAEDFWSAMAQASGRPIDKIMPAFVTQAGAPYLSVEDKCVDNDTVATLSQHRFYSSPKLMQSASDQLWQIPACMNEIGGAATVGCELLARKQQTFNLNGCGHNIFPNFMGSGFYRYSFDPEAYTSLNFHVAELPAEDQVSLVGNEGALLAAGVHHVQDFMAMAEKFRGIDTYGAVTELAGHLTFVQQHLVSDQDRAQFQSWVRGVFKSTLEKVGLNSSTSDTPPQRSTRATLVELLGNVGEDPQAVALARQTVTAYMQNPESVDTTLVDASFPVAAAHGDAALYDSFLAHTKTATSPQDYYRYVHALYQFRSPALLQRTLTWTLGPDVRNQDLWNILGVLSNPEGQQLGWDFVRQRWTDIQNKAGASIVGAQFAYYAVGVFCDPQRAKEAQTFIDQHHVQGLDRVARQQMERVEQCIDLRRREEPNLANFLRRSAHAAAQY